MYCYRFPDRATFLATCDTLGWLSEPSEEAPEATLIAYTADRAIDEVGCIQTVLGTYDEEGNEITPPVLSQDYHIDVCWDLSDSFDEDGNPVYADHPYGWKTYETEPDNPLHKLY